jgi:hypothetical protein
MAGVNLNALGIAPISLYANYFKRSGHARRLHRPPEQLRRARAAEAVRPRGGGLMEALVQWGGLDITTGFERATWG